jgi:peroxiredoxin
MVHAVFGRIGLALILCAAVLSGCSASGQPGSHPSGATSNGVLPVGATVFPPGQRKHVAPLRAQTLAGTELALADLLGAGPVVVNVWASWCIECRQESSDLAALSRDMRGRGVRFVGIDEQDDPASGRRFALAAHIDYPQLIDKDGSLLARLTVLPRSGIPSTLVIDRQGLMAARIIGAASVALLSPLIAAAQS